MITAWMLYAIVVGSLLAAGGLVSGGNIQDAVGVDVKRDLDLRHAARRGRDSI